MRKLELGEGIGKVLRYWNKHLMDDYLVYKRSPTLSYIHYDFPRDQMNVEFLPALSLEDKVLDSTWVGVTMNYMMRHCEW